MQNKTFTDALISISIVTLEQITLCDVKDNLTLQFPFSSVINFSVFYLVAFTTSSFSVLFLLRLLLAFLSTASGRWFLAKTKALMN